MHIHYYGRRPEGGEVVLVPTDTNYAPRWQTRGTYRLPENLHDLKNANDVETAADAFRRGNRRRHGITSPSIRSSIALRLDKLIGAMPGARRGGSGIGQCAAEPYLKPDSISLVCNHQSVLRR